MGDIQKSWQQIAAQKRADQAALIEEFCNLEELATVVDRTDLGHVELFERLCRGECTAREAVVGYIHRAIEAHRQTNCLTEILFTSALQRADELDAHFREHGKPIGPLHGLPVSVKDQFDIKGVDSTIGYVGRAYHPHDEDAGLVTILHDLGAVVIAKTNVPQSLLMAETENPLWGLTTNPRDPSFTPGGSSGGEAALLACQGSLIGWGTDIGGSIRSPCSMMGLYGLKPSHGRLPYTGISSSNDGQEHIPSVAGPMARSLKSLVAATKAVIDAKPWEVDPRCIALPWRAGLYEEVSSRPLTVGVIWDDGVVAVHPPIRRALGEVVEKLEEAGHEVLEWGTEDHRGIIDVQDQYYTSDGGHDIRLDISKSNEPFLPHVQALVDRGKPISVYEYWQLNKAKTKLQKRYLERWNSTRSPKTGRKVDVLLGPVMAHSAVPHGKCRWVGYTKVFNFLDYPALTLPVSTISPEQYDVFDENYKPRNELDEWNWRLFDGERMRGHPVGLQIVGRRLEEEVVLGVAGVVEGVLRGADGDDRVSGTFDPDSNSA